MPIVNNLNEISDVYLGSEKITDVYAGNDKVKSGQQELPWTQPVLSTNGTMGGDSFACDQKSYYSGGRPYYAYRAFDNNISTDWENDAMTVAGLTPPTWISWYNPNPLKISKITIISGGAGGYHNPKDFKIQVSDDNINWSDIYTGTNSLTGSKITWSIDINSPSFFKYWRFYILTTNEGNNPKGYVMPCIYEIYLTATQIV